MPPNVSAKQLDLAAKNHLFFMSKCSDWLSTDLRRCCLTCSLTYSLSRCTQQLKYSGLRLISKNKTRPSPCCAVRSGATHKLLTFPVLATFFSLFTGSVIMEKPSLESGTQPLLAVTYMLQFFYPHTYSTFIFLAAYIFF